jgi:hypothetical protein
MALPVVVFSDQIIFAAYKHQHKLFKSKRYVIKVNLMDNQASKIIKQYLTSKECDLTLVEPHNHHMNAVECAIQTFKNHFISALAATDS